VATEEKIQFVSRALSILPEFEQCSSNIFAGRSHTVGLHGLRAEDHLRIAIGATFRPPLL
jgi:hypothetical protein